MTIENIVSVKLSSDQMQQVSGALQTLQEVLGSQLVVLRPDERRELPKISERNLPFVEKVLEYCVSMPQFAPPYLSIDELKIDVSAVKNLTALQRSIDQLAMALGDTIMLSGSEAYVAALTYYNAVKQAAKVHVAGAEAVYNDIGIRFDYARKAKPADELPTV